ncbi:SUMF1/EgtB/PvdO family nonheme iron enzyme [Chloroflexales bacterium ZM16-3]|nr:SUMF1/EgtB/PvdO family nonheme iron enzyme [Chloroflexales bacterium ZM16-3]
MSDIAAKIAALEAQIAALRAEAPPPAQRIEADTASDNIQASAGRDALVLREITIAPGGTLVVGGQPLDLPPDPADIQAALVAYLHSLFERYCFLNLTGLAGGARQARVELRSVFVSVRTDYTIPDLGALLGEQADDAPRRSTRMTLKSPAQLSDDLRRWLDELLPPEDRQWLVAADAAPQPDSGRAAPDDHREQVVRMLQARRTALELIRHEPALVLLGDPGSGKTTVLRHLALGFAHARLHADAPGAALDPELAWDGPLPLPILVQLRRFAEGLSGPPASADPLLRHIEGVLADDRLDALARHLLARLEAGSVILLLDGLDEVADDTRRAWVSQAAARFQSRFPKSRVVLTSRIYAYRDTCMLPPPFRVVTIQPLEQPAQDDFLLRWYRAALLQGSELAGDEQERAAQERSRELIDALSRRPRLREIAANPLLLTMIALVHQHRYRLPQQRADLYKECLLLLLDQWEQRRAEGEPAGLAVELGVPDQTDRLALIQPIAYELQLCGREEASNREARRWLLERFLDLANGDGERAKALIGRFLDFLEGRSGLLIARDIKERYAFPHKTFQEYLAARELIRSERMLEEIVDHRHAATWREVILLVAGQLVAGGLVREARAIAWKLLDADPEGSEGFYRSAALAGEILEELGGVLGREGQSLKEQVVTALVQLVQGGALGANERVDAAFLLARLGDPRLPAPKHPAYWCDVAPGPFWYSDDQKGELKQVCLDYAYKIARFPVTNAAFADFMEAGGYEREAWWTPEGWKYSQRSRWSEPRYWRDSRYNEPTQPVVGVSWYEAAAYCIWLTEHGHRERWLPADAEIRLPTSLEWERAARGDDSKRRYPWGDDPPTPEHSNYGETGIGQPAPVGCFPLGAAGCGGEDMAGNVYEWMCSTGEQPERAQKDFTPDTGALLSWSYFGDSSEYLCCGSRIRYSPCNWNYSWSFRVLWSPRST